jgi:hypothetical protein
MGYGVWGKRCLWVRQRVLNFEEGDGGWGMGKEAPLGKATGFELEIG